MDAFAGSRYAKWRPAPYRISGMTTQKPVIDNAYRWLSILFPYEKRNSVGLYTKANNII